jgi:hypothetical protein
MIVTRTFRNSSNVSKASYNAEHIKKPAMLKYLTLRDVKSCVVERLRNNDEYYNTPSRLLQILVCF